MFSPTTEKLIKIFSQFPTVGPRTAARFVFYLINSSQEKVDELLQSIEELKQKTKLCAWCFKSYEAENGQGLCPICADSQRDKTQICIVEKEVDLETLEKTNKFKGLYFILGSSFSHFKKEEQEQLEEKLKVLLNRISNPTAFAPNGAMAVKEIILALNPTREGQNTALWLKRKLAPIGVNQVKSAKGSVPPKAEQFNGVKISQLGIGLPLGGELEYADEETLTSAIDNRK